MVFIDFRRFWRFRVGTPLHYTQRSAPQTPSGWSMQSIPCRAVQHAMRGKRAADSMCFAQPAALVGVQKSQVCTKRHLQKFKCTSADTSELADPIYGLNAFKIWSSAGSEAPGGPSGQPGQRPDRPGTILEASGGVPERPGNGFGTLPRGSGPTKGRSRNRPGAFPDTPGTVRSRFLGTRGCSGMIFWGVVLPDACHVRNLTVFPSFFGEF